MPETRKPGWALEKLQKMMQLRDFYAEGFSQTLAFEEMYEHDAFSEMAERELSTAEEIEYQSNRGVGNYPA